MQAGENDARGGVRTRDALCALHLKCSPFDQLGHPCFCGCGEGVLLFFGGAGAGGLVGCCWNVRQTYTILPVALVCRST